MEGEARQLRTRFRWVLLGSSLAWLLLAPTATPGELIRYRGADGSIGFAGSEASVPPGAVILTRRASSEDAPRESGADIPSIADLVSGVRAYCDSRARSGGDDFDDCITDQTRAAFQLRDLLLEQRPGSEASRLIEDCRRRGEPKRAPDYRSLLGCAERSQEEFEARTGVHPADVDVDRDVSDAEALRRKHDERLRGLRDDQARATRELEIGRNQWHPRYQKAERELRDAEQRTRSIVERMHRRGCREDSLACGGLGPQLVAAQRDEKEKRDYLEHGLLNECRLAGCQPGWLR